MSYDKEIEKRIKQQSLIKNKIDKSGRAAAKKGDLFGTFGAAKKVNKLNKSINTLASDYKKSKKTKGYN